MSDRLNRAVKTYLKAHCKASQRTCHSLDRADAVLSLSDRTIYILQKRYAHFSARLCSCERRSRTASVLFAQNRISSHVSDLFRATVTNWSIKMRGDWNRDLVKDVMFY